MLYKIGVGRALVPDGAALDRPLGRGLNLQIKVAAVAPLVAALEAAGIAPALPVEEQWYRAGDVLHGLRQFMVGDPDGYLLRPSEPLGSVRVEAAEGPSPARRGGVVANP